jgi:outer membrane lipoprotein-sorting protein
MQIKSLLFFFILVLFINLLYGCPKKPPEVLPPEKPSFVNPIEKFLKEFSSVDSFQARTSIRIETERGGEETNFLLNGILLFQRPNKLRVLGYHPLGMSIFDALYQNGQLLIFIPFQRRIYEGYDTQFDEIMEKAGEISVKAEREEGAELPSQIRIEALDIGARIWLRLKDISLNPVFSEETFRLDPPEGIEIRSIARLLRGKKLR